MYDDICALVMIRNPSAKFRVNVVVPFQLTGVVAEDDVTPVAAAGGVTVYWRIARLFTPVIVTADWTLGIRNTRLVSPALPECETGVPPPPVLVTVIALLG